MHLEDNNMKATYVICNYLMYHVADLQKRKTAIARQYSKEYDAYVKMLRFLDAYLQGIEEQLDACQRVTGPDIAPFVILGSVEEVKNTETGESMRLCVTLPVEGMRLSYDKEAKTVSCFSAAGRALLFMEPGQPFALEDGRKSFVINEIEYPLNL